jgi:lipoprotein-releasing system permease protein
MNIVLYLSSKYLKFKVSDRGLSVMAVIALLAIVIGSAAAVVILSAANGFHNNLLQKLMSKDSHMIILAPGRGIPAYQQYIDKISNIKGVKSVIPYFERQALLKGALNTWGATVMGIPSEFYGRQKDFQNQFHMESGAFDLNKPLSIVLGYNLADNLGVGPGSIVELSVFSESFFTLQYKFKVAGTFSVGYRDYDSSLAFISFKDSQLIFDAAGYAYGLAVRVDKPFEIDSYVREVRKVCPYTPFTWKTLHRNDYAALQDEKVMIMIILAFFFIVVAASILSTMIAMVLDKKEEIGILKAMGLKPSDTLKVFLFNGFFLGAGGGVFGVLLGLLVSISLNDILRFIETMVDFVNFTAYYAIMWMKRMPAPENFKFIKSSVYYIDKFPMQILWSDLVFVFLLSVALSTLAVIVPAFTASKMRPVEVLRND